MDQGGRKGRGKEHFLSHSGMLLEHGFLLCEEMFKRVRDVVAGLHNQPRLDGRQVTVAAMLSVPQERRPTARPAGLQVSALFASVFDGDLSHS